MEEAVFLSQKTEGLAMLITDPDYHSGSDIEKILQAVGAAASGDRIVRIGRRKADGSVPVNVKMTSLFQRQRFSYTHQAVESFFERGAFFGKVETDEMIHIFPEKT